MAKQKIHEIPGVVEYSDKQVAAAVKADRARVATLIKAQLETAKGWADRGVRTNVTNVLKNLGASVKNGDTLAS